MTKFFLFLVSFFNVHTTSVDSPKFISYVSHGPRTQPNIALTFDADMTPGMVEELKQGKVKSWYNDKIVEILEREKIPATIFMSGMWAELYPDISRQLASNPLFEIANHSYSHPRFADQCFALPAMPTWGGDGEFEKSQSAIKKITGITPNFFRFPGGCQTDTDIKLANRYGLTVVGWDAASTDSFNDNLPAIINSIKTKTQNGSILLFHFHGNKNAPHSAEALEATIPYLRSKGFNFVKLSELLN
ncbi:polysaccharide deacetylase family protein [Candidatus Shapirobacteria bacterium]|nr:polysaccharide deacetylase family protein [Candidatus Shapirobacteria bacterium]